MTGREQRESIRHVESVLKIRSRLSQLAFQPELKVKCLIFLFSFIYIILVLGWVDFSFAEYLWYKNVTF